MTVPCSCETIRITSTVQHCWIATSPVACLTEGQPVMTLWPLTFCTSCGSTKRSKCRFLSTTAHELTTKARIRLGLSLTKTIGVDKYQNSCTSVQKSLGQGGHSLGEKIKDFSNALSRLIPAIFYHVLLNGSYKNNFHIAVKTILKNKNSRFFHTFLHQINYEIVKTLFDFQALSRC